MTNFLAKGWTALFALLLVAGVACDKDDIDQLALTDFPPGVLQISPADNGSVVRGAFDVKAFFVDGSTSPLSTATLQVLDQSGAELGSTTKTLSGTRDSIVLAAADFGAETLELGDYQIKVSATDSKGQSVERTTTFTISALPFPANIEKLYVAGVFNGWSSDAAVLDAEYRFTLVAANTWEISGIDLEGTAFKFKNTADWSDEDWGDPQCDGIMDSNKNGNGDTDCGFSGESVIRFNDATLTYTVEPLVTVAKNVDGLYLLGTFDGVSNALGEGDPNGFTLTGDNTWELDEVTLRPGDKFKFVENANFSGKNFGDADMDGVAEEFGPVITFEGEEGVYKMTFNDETLAYSSEFIKGLGFQSIGIIGDATGSWDQDIDMSDDDGDGVYEILIGLGDGQVKFRADDDWATSWGSPDFPSGTGALGGDNIQSTPGLYMVKFTPATGEYSFEAATFGIIGSATPTGWDADTDLVVDPATPNVLSTTITLGEGAVKWRLNDDWASDWGASDFPSGVATFKGPDLAVATPGTYTVKFNVVTLAYSFE